MAKASPAPPDHVLVVAAILGDLEAFGELATRYRAAVVRAAQAIVGRDHAEDVAQDALILAFKALPSIEEPAKFAAWLFAITRHRAFRYGKREHARQAGRVEFDELLLARVGSLTRPLVDERQVDDELEKALARVPDDYSLVLRLRFLDDMPLKRIAAFLGVSVSTVKWRVHRGKQLLRRQLELLRERGEVWKEAER
ncbi:MAG TPA: RNA polymerase sigma factor [Blastocatellia bacterium]|jgi:RNA polymerase sigma-70 factor (ECF subfamily)|nr:RNA polymerase sigma factor [Blastocatellia bacterium]